MGDGNGEIGGVGRLLVELKRGTRAVRTTLLFLTVEARTSM